MKARTIKLKTRSDLRGGHVHIGLWLGPENGTLQKLGSLVVDAGDQWLILDSLSLGAEQLVTNGRLLVEHTGDIAEADRWVPDEGA